MNCSGKDYDLKSGGLFFCYYFSFAFFVIYFVIYFVDSHWDFVREILNLTLQVLKAEGKFFAQVKILKHCNLDCVVV